MNFPLSQNFNWEENAKGVPGLLERVDAPLSPVAKSHRSSLPSLSNLTSPPPSPQHLTPPQCPLCECDPNAHSSDQCPGRPVRAFRSSLKVNISANSDRDRQHHLTEQANDINEARLRNAVTRADNLFAKHVALDGTQAVERHRLAARKANLRHQYVTTTQHGVYEAVRVIPAPRYKRPRRQRRNGPPTAPVNVPRRPPVVHRPRLAPVPVARRATWRTQHRADTPSPPGFGGVRRVSFAPPARPGQPFVRPRLPVFSRLDGVRGGRFQPPPYRPPQLFIKNQPHQNQKYQHQPYQHQPYQPQPYQPQPYQPQPYPQYQQYQPKTPWNPNKKSNNYYTSLS